MAEKKGYQTTTSEYHGEFGETVNRETREAPRISPEGLQSRLDRVTVLDMRSQQNIAKSGKRIPSARHVDPDRSGWMDTLPKESTYILYCDSPGEETSARAALRMIEQGFHEVHVLSGGWQAWSSKGYATRPVSEEETA